MKFISYSLILLFICCKLAFGSPFSFELKGGVCSYRMKGESFKDLVQNESFGLSLNSILKSDSLKGTFVFEAGKAEVESELLCQINNHGEFVFVHGKLRLNITENFELKTPSCKLVLKPGVYELALMEGLGVLKILEGSGKVLNSTMSISFKSGEKAIFNSLGKIDIKVNS